MDRCRCMQQKKEINNEEWRYMMPHSVIYGIKCDILCVILLFGHVRLALLCIQGIERKAHQIFKSQLQRKGYSFTFNTYNHHQQLPTKLRTRSLCLYRERSNHNKTNQNSHHGRVSPFIQYKNIWWGKGGKRQKRAT